MHTWTMYIRLVQFFCRPMLVVCVLVLWSTCRARRSYTVIFGCAFLFVRGRGRSPRGSVALRHMKSKGVTGEGREVGAFTSAWTLNYCDENWERDMGLRLELEHMSAGSQTHERDFLCCFDHVWPPKLLSALYQDGVLKSWHIINLLFFINIVNASNK